MKRFLFFLLIIFLAYLTAFYTTGKDNGYEDPFNFSHLEQKLNDWFDDQNNYEETVNPDFDGSYIENGLHYIETENYDRALDEFFNALYENDNSEINYYIGHVYLLQGDYSSAMYYLDAAVNLDPVNAKAYRDRGIVKYEQTKYEEAVKDLIVSSETDSDDPITHYKLALCYEELNKNDLALQSAETAIKTDTSNIDYFFKAAYLAYELEQYETSVKHYKSLLEIDPFYQYALVNLGLNYASTDKYDSAVYYYDIAIEKYPNYALVYNNKGYVFQKQGDYITANTLYNKAIELDQDDTRPIWNRGDCYFALKNYNKALEDYKRVYAINSEYYNAVYQIGECYEMMNEYDNALIYYQKYKNISDSESKFYTEVELKIKKLQ